MQKPDNQVLVIFGASGDLASRKLLPALYELHTRQLLPDEFRIIGIARSPYTNDTYRTWLRNRLETQPVTEEDVNAQLTTFLKSIEYLAFDPTQPTEYALLNQHIAQLTFSDKTPDRILYYLATPPALYKPITNSLRENGLHKPQQANGWRRIIVEKPFGMDLSSARDLNTHLCTVFDEKEIFRIDHYLGKETVQNILVLRFANGIFEPLWNRNYIDSVEISATETLGIEKRGKYYDRAGALRDMIQNHLIQLMGFIAMEAPAVFESETIRDEIAKVIRSIRPYTPENIDREIIRAQYEDYRTEADVSPTSSTETFVAMKVFIDNWRWNGVPFYLNTGKKLTAKTSEIVINFKSTPHLLFAGQCSGSSCNKLIIRIQPDESITLRFGLKEPGTGFIVKQVGMDFHYNSLGGTRLPDAYERLLIDAMRGDATLFARNDALLASWTLIDPVLRYWQDRGSEQLYFYPPGSQGPAEADNLIPQNESCSY